MSALFSTPKLPPVPPPEPKPEVMAEDEAAIRGRERQRAMGGRRSTLFTSGLGVTDRAQVKRTKLGGY